MARTQNNAIIKCRKNMWINRNSHSLLDGCKIVYLFKRHSGSFLQNYKHALTIQHCSHIPWYLLRWTGNIIPNKNLLKVYVTMLFLIAETWKKVKCPSSRIMNKQIVIYTIKEILFNAKSKWTMKPWKYMEET